MVASSPAHKGNQCANLDDSDPWWVFTTCCLLYNIRTRYSFGFFELICTSPRFAVMIAAMGLSIIFTVIDICAVTGKLKSVLPIGINPFWKLAFVFKLLTDTVILDDFKTALDKLSCRNIARIEAGFDDNLAPSKAMTMYIESPTALPAPARIAMAGGRKSEESCIEVRTDMKMESFHMEYAEDASKYSRRTPGR